MSINDVFVQRGINCQVMTDVSRYFLRVDKGVILIGELVIGHPRRSLSGSNINETVSG